MQLTFTVDTDNHVQLQKVLIVLSSLADPLYGHREMQEARAVLARAQRAPAPDVELAPEAECPDQLDISREHFARLLSVLGVPVCQQALIDAGIKRFSDGTEAQRRQVIAALVDA